MSNSNRPSQSAEREASATPPGPDPKAVREGECGTINEENPGGFKNDPDDPTNPNEVIERSRRKLRQ